MQFKKKTELEINKKRKENLMCRSDKLVILECLSQFLSYDD